MTFRALTLDDLGGCADVHLQCFDRPWSEQSMGDLVGQDGVFGYVFVLSRVEGFILCRSVLDEAEILTLCVRPDLRGNGTGRRLVELSVEACRARGIKNMYLEVAARNDAAQGLYAALGFCFIGNRPKYYGAQTGLLMGLEIADI